MDNTHLEPSDGFNLYTSCNEDDDISSDDFFVNDEERLIHVNPVQRKDQWNHIKDLDDFFTQVYHYHQRGGLFCMALEDILKEIVHVFVATFAYFLTHCVNYSVLFHNVEYNNTHKVTIHEAIRSKNVCLSGLKNSWMVILMTVVIVVMVCRGVRLVMNISRYVNMRNFYHSALKFSTNNLANVTWHEVQSRLIEVQKEHQMCVHSRELTHLDIYHRILRFQNYLLAMANYEAIPMRFTLPIVGEYVYLTHGYTANLEYILFKGPWAPFDNNWTLNKEYKSSRNKQRLVKRMERRILWFGVFNLLLSPFIFFWNIIYFFFRYLEMFKNRPGFFGTRRWSNYSHLFFRHFNELDHELNSRLLKGFQPTTEYLKLFSSPICTIIAKFCLFISGSFTAVVIGLTVFDEDVLSVSHVITLLFVLGVIISVCRAFIPEEQVASSPEMLLRLVAMALHYMPENWVGNAHTVRMRDSFCNLFQYKMVYILEELLSPIVVPFIQLLCLRRRAHRIVEFLRNFTADEASVGDVCSFAQMDIRKHGNDKCHHPEWKPGVKEGAFIDRLSTQVGQELHGASVMAANTGGAVHSLLTSRSFFSTATQSPSEFPPHDDCSAVNTSTFSVGVFAPSRLDAHSSVSQPPTQTSMSQGEVGAAASSSVSLVSSLYSGFHRPAESFVGSAYWNEIGGSRSSQLSAGHVDYHDNHIREQLITNGMSLAALCLHEANHRSRRHTNLSTHQHRHLSRTPIGPEADLVQRPSVVGQDEGHSRPCGGEARLGGGVICSGPGEVQHPARPGEVQYPAGPGEVQYPAMSGEVQYHAGYGEMPYSARPGEMQYSARPGVMQYPAGPTFGADLQCSDRGQCPLAITGVTDEGSTDEQEIDTSFITSQPPRIHCNSPRTL